MMARSLVRHEAEESLLGGLLISADAWDRVATLVGAEDFVKPARRAVFRAMSRLAEQNQPLDVITVAEAMGADIEKFGGLAWLWQLAKDTPSAANVGHYAAIVREFSVRRRLAEIGTQCAELALGDEPVPDLIDKAQGLVQSLATGAAYRGRKAPAICCQKSSMPWNSVLSRRAVFSGCRLAFRRWTRFCMGSTPAS